MVKKIVRDPMFLQQKSEPATESDKQASPTLQDHIISPKRPYDNVLKRCDNVLKHIDNAYEKPIFVNHAVVYNYL